MRCNLLAANKYETSKMNPGIFPGWAVAAMHKHRFDVASRDFFSSIPMSALLYARCNPHRSQIDVNGDAPSHMRWPYIRLQGALLIWNCSIGKIPLYNKKEKPRNEPWHRSIEERGKWIKHEKKFRSSKSDYSWQKKANKIEIHHDKIPEVIIALSRKFSMWNVNSTVAYCK